MVGVDVKVKDLDILAAYLMACL